MNKSGQPVNIDCANSEWKPSLKQNPQDWREVDLLNLDYTVDGHFCEMFAIN